MEDYYEVLGVHRTATVEEIAATFRRQALRWHPDKNPADRDRAHREFIRIHEAYEVLRGAASRAAYDASSSWQAGRTDARQQADSRGGQQRERQREEARHRRSEDSHARGAPDSEDVRRAATEGREHGEAAASMNFEEFVEELGRRWRQAKRRVAQAVADTVEGAMREQRAARRVLATENDRKRRAGTPASLIVYGLELSVDADTVRGLWADAVRAGSAGLREEFADTSPGGSGCAAFAGTAVLFGLGLLLTLGLAETRVRLGPWPFLPAVAFFVWSSITHAIATVRAHARVRREVRRRSGTRQSDEQRLHDEAQRERSRYAYPAPNRALAYASRLGVDSAAAHSVWCRIVKEEVQQDDMIYGPFAGYAALVACCAATFTGMAWVVGRLLDALTVWWFVVPAAGVVACGIIVRMRVMHTRMRAFRQRIRGSTSKS